MMTSERYLLDTCAVIFLANGEQVSEEAVQVLSTEMPDSIGIFVSAFSAWEVAKLVSKGRLHLTRAPLPWFDEAITRFGAEVLPATAEILVASCFLPEPLHGDPADRILVATAREHDLTIITRDRAVLAYGAAGHVKVLAC